MKIKIWLIIENRINFNTDFLQKRKRYKLKNQNVKLIDNLRNYVSYVSDTLQKCLKKLKEGLLNKNEE